MFFSAIAELDLTRKTPTLEHQGDPAFWHIVAISDWLALHFSLLNPDTGPLGRIICGLTGSPVYHVETWLDDEASDEVRNRADYILGRPYDFTGALRAWDDSGYHNSPAEWWCSDTAAFIIQPVLPGIFQYPNPGKLLLDVSAMLNKPVPKLAALPKGLIGDNEQDYLRSLVPDQLATGDVQRVQQALEAQSQLT
jgi:hypothetical protein